MYKVAFLGPKASFTEEAALKIFSNTTYELIPQPTIRDVFRSVERGVCDYGVIPLENSIEGSVSETLDMLTVTPLKIVVETEVRIRLCLISKPGTKLSDISTILSHPHALAQCRNFIDNFLRTVKLEIRSSTSEAVKEAIRMDGVAAIGSHYAARVYGGEILIDGIEDFSENYTRFIAVGHKELDLGGTRGKTAIIFTLPHRPGTLYSALQVFAVRDINLTKIESRPIKGRPWEYMFYVEFEGSINDSKTSDALNELRGRVTSLKLLGSFKKVI